MRENPAGTLIDLTPILSGSEAVFAFAGWLTSRDEPVTMSAVHDAAGPADLVAKFNERQGLADPRSGWDRSIKPMGCKTKGGSKGGKKGKGKK
jgi:hypothetical protein